MCWWVISLFVIFAVLDVSFAVNLCIKCSVFTFIHYQELTCELHSVPVLWRSRRDLAGWQDCCQGWLGTCRRELVDSLRQPARFRTLSDTGCRKHRQRNV